MEWRSKEEQETVEKKDVEFNEYVTLFSLPSTSEPRKAKRKSTKKVSFLCCGSQTPFACLSDKDTIFSPLKRIGNVPFSEESVELEEMTSDIGLVDAQSVAQCEWSGEK